MKLLFLILLLSKERKVLDTALVNQFEADFIRDEALNEASFKERSPAGPWLVYTRRNRQR
ncbi:hypothetical protein AAHE18_14G018300 [Arachis hypogaea]